MTTQRSHPVQEILFAVVWIIVAFTITGGRGLIGVAFLAIGAASLLRALSTLAQRYRESSPGGSADDPAEPWQPGALRGIPEETQSPERVETWTAPEPTGRQDADPGPSAAPQDGTRTGIVAPDELTGGSGAYAGEVAEGWYPTADGTRERWHNGSSWTAHERAAGSA